MKYLLLSLALVLALMSCHTSKKKDSSTTTTVKENSIVKSVLNFDNCDSLKSFLGAMIVTNKTDKTLAEGHFKMRYMLSTYNDTKSLFPPNCFNGIPIERLEELFGKWEYGGSSLDNHPAYYYLDNNGARFVIGFFIKNGKVENWEAGPGYVNK